MPKRGDLSRRALLAGASAAPALTALGPQPAVPVQASPPALPDLSGAKWIWLPCQRTLACTFVLFRRVVDLPARPERARLWIAADSRYKLTINGRRVQWGPAPCDPRWLDLDPADVAAYLQPGANVIGVEVLFYGVGDGTWPAGKPGLLVRGGFDLEGGQRITVATDDSWLAFLDRAHPPGHYKRWFLRALQEEFDARLHPYGWDTAAFKPDRHWMKAALLRCPADKPPSSASGSWSGDTIDRANPAKSYLREREIPAVRESEHAASRLAESGRVRWLRDPEDWFQFRMEGSFELDRTPVARATGERQWELPDSAFATFEFPFQMVGFPKFTVEAAAGTVIEAMPQESHDPSVTGWLDTHHFSWSRFICREGLNEFECFDYESLRWLQLHVHNAARPVLVRDVGIRRRQFAWLFEPKIRTSDAAVQRLFEAAINTVRNSVIETAVDGMGRERQQYSGDGGHQLHAVRYAFGETRAPQRYLRTFSQGQMKDGYFSDSWPAYDRLARVSQKEMDGAYWGPLLDHGVGFNFDCWNHYLETGDREALAEPYPRLKRFAAYLEALVGRDGLLPVEDLGIPTVWMDHIAYKRPRHKQCSFNLYTAAMLEHALAPVAELFGDQTFAGHCRELAGRLLTATRARYWSGEGKLFVDNLPWQKEERELRLSDRSLATAILFAQCPGNDIGASAEALAALPSTLGISYPCNAGWRYWALAKAGRVQPIVDDFRRRWATMRSVVENLSIQEDWQAKPDSGTQWSHAGVAPLYIAYMDMAGIRPLEPGFQRVSVRPQLGDLPNLELTAHTPRGPIEFRAEQRGGGLWVRVGLPDGCAGELLAPGRVPQPFTGSREFTI